MIPFAPAGFHDELIQIFNGNVCDMRFGEAVLRHMLGNFILPYVDFQLVAVPAAPAFPFSGAEPAFVAVEIGGRQFDAGNKYRNMPHPDHKDIQKQNLKSGKTFQHPTHLPFHKNKIHMEKTCETAPAI